MHMQRPWCLLSLFVAVIVVVSACDKLPETDDTDTRPRFDATADTRIGSDTFADTGDVSADAREPVANTWQIRISDDAPEPVHWAAEDVAAYLGQMGLETAILAATADDAFECQADLGTVVMVGDGVGTVELDTAPSKRTNQTWRWEETRCDDGGRLVTLTGNGLLGRQYAAYAWLHALGVRFFHPEHEYVPAEPDWPAEPAAEEKTPPFEANSVSLHLTHPLELGDAFRERDEQYFPEAKRYIDWQIKNFASFGTHGVGSGELSDYGLRRGFPRSSGFSLHNQQQGASAIIDPDDPRSEEEQIAEAIDEEMGPGPDYPDYFQFGFNPSEFTGIPDQDAVRQLTFIANYMAENYPDTKVYTTNHGSHMPPTENYGVRYFDLPQFAPPNLGVKVHTLMFYDLQRPAPVYGNENFHFLYDFMVQEYQTRELWYFPEAAWWLTFDIAVPLYLPITIEARSRDIQLLRFMLDDEVGGKLEGHRSFGTGHEWGYWQNEYCSLRMAADLEYDWRDCLSDIVYPMGDAAPDVHAALVDLIALQERDFIYDEELLAYLVGTDPETEIAASVGIEFHPLPPQPSAIMRWDLEDISRWRRRIEPALVRFESDYQGILDRLTAVEENVAAGGEPWFAEIRDGVEATLLRARHARQVYGAVVTLRESRLRFDPTMEEDAQALLDAARATTEDAIAVVRRREEGYRYSPIERSIAGGPDLDQDDNWTVYSYRYLARTHHGYYYTRIDELAADAFAGSGDAVEVPDTVLAPEEILEVRVVDTDLGAVDVDFGDGSTDSGLELSHAYDAADVYELLIQGESETASVDIQSQVASVLSEVSTGFTGTVVEPEGAELIEPVFPALVLGRVDDARLVLGYDLDGGGEVGLDRFEVLDAADATALVSQPSELIVPVVNRDEGAAITSIVVQDAVVEHDPGTEELLVTGQLLSQGVIDALVAVGGFEEDGARSIVASTLGYTADTLPERLPFTVSWSTGEEASP